MTWQSFGSGPPPAGVKQFVAPEIRINFKESNKESWLNLQGAPQTFTGGGIDCCSSTCWYELGLTGGTACCPSTCW